MKSRLAIHVPPAVANHRRRRGAAYVMVLAASLMITVIGVSSVAVARIKTAATTRANDWAQAQTLAFSAIEQAITVLNTTSNWRSVYTHNTDTTAVTLGNGSIRYRVIDTADTSLSDDPTDAFYIQSTATVGQCTYKLRVRVISLGGSTLSVDTTSWTRVVN